MSKFAVFAYGIALICGSRIHTIHTGLTLEGYHLVDIISFTTGTDVSPLVDMQEALSMAHSKNSKPSVGIAGSVICAFLFLFNLT